MAWLRIGLGGLGLLLLVLIGALVIALQPSVLKLPATDLANESPTKPLKVMFLGTSSMAWTDGENTWLVDGFFSRHSIQQVMLTRLKVDEPTVQAVAEAVFSRLKVAPELSGILVAHSHYDHALDAPFLTARYGGKVIGSESTRQIALGQQLPEEKILVPTFNASIKLGRFDVRVLKSAHAPTGFTGGFNTRPLSLPAHALQFKEGSSYSFVVSHPAKGEQPFALIQPSAGFLPAQNRGLKVEVVFLGVGGLGKLSEAYLSDYWQEMVVNTGAKEVYLIHWDDFTQPLLQNGQFSGLKAMPKLLDDFPRSLEVLNRFSKRDNVRLNILDAWQTLDF